MSLRWTILAPVYDKMSHKTEDGAGRHPRAPARRRRRQGPRDRRRYRIESDQGRSLAEIHRVLRPGGRLLFIEHVRSDDPALARLQDRINWLNRFLVGCERNRRTLAAIEDAGFTVSRAEQAMLPEAPKFVRPLIMGAAVSAKPS